MKKCELLDPKSVMFIYVLIGAFNLVYPLECTFTF